LREPLAVAPHKVGDLASTRSQVERYRLQVVLATPTLYGFAAAVGELSYIYLPFSVMLIALLALAGPARADFYTPPSPLPPGQPGDIIRAQPMTAYLLPLVAMQAHAWRILYRSTTATGQPTVDSGEVLVPTASYSGPRPLIGYCDRDAGPRQPVRPVAPVRHRHRIRGVDRPPGAR
jgi:hypothetical protein